MDWTYLINKQAFFLAYIICSNLGVKYGTGQHKSDLSENNYARAMQVSKPGNSHQCLILTIPSVLVVLLPLLQHHNDNFKNLICMVPPPNRCQTNPHVDYIRSFYVHNSWRRGLFLRLTAAMPASLVLLGQA